MEASTPKSHSKYGYKPPFKVRAIRKFAKILISIFGLNSNNKLSTELQQMLDPEITVAIPENKSLVFNTGHGRLLWRANTLFTEEQMIIDWINSFEENDVFYDIGANVGIYSVYAAKLRDLKVYSFEPEINNIQTLYANIYKNELFENCTIVPIAADNEIAIKPFHIREFTKGGALNTIGRDPFYESQNADYFKSDTFCATVDSLVEIFKLQKPTKIKIDVDTNELRVIEGMLNTLESKILEEIYIELDFNQEEHQKVIVILEKKGFEIIKKESPNLKHESKIFNCLLKKK